MENQTAPPIQKITKGDDVQNEDSYKIDDDKWTYYEEDNDYLLRYGKVENERGAFIRFDVLNTKIIDKKMFTGNEKINFLNEELKTPKNFDLLTYMAMNFEKMSPIFEYVSSNDNINLKITNKGNNITISLRSEDCKDETFFNKNRERKIKQIEANLEKKKAEFEKENKELIEINTKRRKELDEIKKINKYLETENFKVSKALKDLEEIQSEALEQLKKIN